MGVIAAQREVIARAVADRDSAARRAIERIEQAGAADGLADKWWDDWGAPLVKLVSKLAGLVATLAGMLAIVLAFVPFVGPILAAGLLAISGLASLLAALADVTLAISGDGTWGQAALSIVFAGLSCIGLGSLRTMAGSAKGLASAPKMWANAGGLRQVGGARGLARAYGANAKTAALELRQATIQTLRHPATKLKNAAKALRANRWTTPGRGAKDRLKELVAKSDQLKAERDELIAQIEDLLPEGYAVKHLSSKRIEDTLEKMELEGVSGTVTGRLQIDAIKLSKLHGRISRIGEEIGEVGGLAHLEGQGVRVVDSFLAPGPGKMRLDAMGLSADGKTLIVAEFKGLKAELSGTPRATMLEGLAKQGTAPYTRDRMLTDSRVAQYLADTPRVWGTVTSGQMQYQLQVIYTRSPEIIKSTVLDFDLTPEVLEELTKRVNKLLS
ncbi:hypothetical protein [Buchananella hordeovulneris]|uniref:hypothetical protein n=1 Tax=Buchananella hordeovulneris TaxID=52770 RepID=UPI001161366B|nr:hypothetical protein [Buchananella hordeovulneris]